MANEGMDTMKIAMTIAGGLYQLLLKIPFELNKFPRMYTIPSNLPLSYLK